MSDEARMVTTVGGQLFRWYRAEAVKRGVSMASLMRVALIWYMTNNKAGSLYDDPRRTKQASESGAVPPRLAAALSFGDRSSLK